MTFNLSDAVLGSLDPILETDPTILRRWADAIEGAGLAYLRSGHVALADRKLVRARHLRALANQAVTS